MDLLKPNWRELLDDALDNNLFGDDDSLAAYLCEVLVGLPNRPTRRLALATAMRERWRYVPLGHIDRAAFEALFNKIWSAITEERLPYGENSERTLRLNWREDYDQVMYSLYDARHDNPFVALIALRLLAWLKNGRRITFADAQVASGRFSHTDPLPAWNMICTVVDNMDALAAHCSDSEAGVITSKNNGRRLWLAFRTIQNIMAGNFDDDTNTLAETSAD